MHAPTTRAPWRAVILGGAVLVCAMLVTAATVADPPRISAAALTAIRAANQAWLPAMERGDAAAIVAPYAADALFITAGGEAVHGRDAIAALYRARLAALARVAGGDLVSDGHAAAAADLVYEWGHASLLVTHKDGTHSRGGGPYLTVWHRDASGHWRIIRNVVF